MVFKCNAIFRWLIQTDSYTGYGFAGGAGTMLSMEGGSQVKSRRYFWVDEFIRNSFIFIVHYIYYILYYNTIHYKC